jgi:hypothetical protein
MVGSGIKTDESLTLNTNGADSDQLTATARMQREIRCWRCGRPGHGRRECTATAHVNGHQLLLAAHERYDDDNMYEMTFTTDEEVNDFNFMNLGTVHDVDDDDEYGGEGRCQSCKRYGPKYKACEYCTNQGATFEDIVESVNGSDAVPDMQGVQRSRRHLRSPKQATDRNMSWMQK